MDEGAAAHPQHGCAGEVGLLDQAMLAERQVAQRGEVIEVSQLGSGGFPLDAGPLELLVLDLQLNLVHPQLVDQPLGGDAHPFGGGGASLARF